jgi:metal-responsive CopG/Arc/MetJ family transcriptional regulator
MRNLESIQKQQVGLRLPVYLIDELDALGKSHDLNRSELITEAVRSFIEEQKAMLFYREFESSCVELKDALAGRKETKTLDGLIGELENN